MSRAYVLVATADVFVGPSEDALFNSLRYENGETRDKNGLVLFQLNGGGEFMATIEQIGISKAKGAWKIEGRVEWGKTLGSHFRGTYYPAHKGHLRFYKPKQA